MVPVIVRVRTLVCNPPSLRVLSVCSIRQSISHISQNVKENFFEKLSSGELHELRNPDVPVSLADMCLMERKLVLESLEYEVFDLLEMSILLIDDIVEFDVRPGRCNLDTVRKRFCSDYHKTYTYRQHEYLLLTLLKVRCPKLKSLTLHPLTRSHAALQMFCEGMSHITKLSLPYATRNDRYKGVLRAISSNMHHLKYLDISHSDVDPKAIEYLLPTEDNDLDGCPELVHLDLCHINHLGVELLKKIILALPKLQVLKHELVVDALVNLTEQEMGEDTARAMNSLYAGHTYKIPSDSCSLIRYDVLAKAPAFQRFKNNVTAVNIHVQKDEKGQQESSSLLEVLMCLPKLRSIVLGHISEAHIHVLPLLESIGDRLEYLELSDLFGNLSLQTIMKTCRNIEDLTIHHSHMDEDALRNGSNLHQDRPEELSKMPLLYCLKSITLTHMDKRLCSADMLIALLQSPNLNSIFIVGVDALTDDVMWNVFSSRGGAALSKVTRFTVKLCPKITTAPLVHWISREKWALQYICFSMCAKIEAKILTAAAEKSHKALVIEEHEVRDCRD